MLKYRVELNYKSSRSQKSLILWSTRFKGWWWLWPHVSRQSSAHSPLCPPPPGLSPAHHLHHATETLLSNDLKTNPNGAFWSLILLPGSGIPSSFCSLPLCPLTNQRPIPNQHSAYQWHSPWAPSFHWCPSPSFWGPFYPVQHHLATLSYSFLSPHLGSKLWFSVLSYLLFTQRKNSD